MILPLKVKRLHLDAILPTKAYPTDAGWDIYSIKDECITPGDRELIPTGIAIEIPEGYYGQIFDRSGMATKKGLHCMSGVIDSSYRGEIHVLMLSTESNSEMVNISKGDKIAQIVILPVPEMLVEEVYELTETDRGNKGFGSSGQ